MRAASAELLSMTSDDAPIRSRRPSAYRTNYDPLSLYDNRSEDNLLIEHTKMYITDWLIPAAVSESAHRSAFM